MDVPELAANPMIFRGDQQFPIEFRCTARYQNMAGYGRLRIGEDALTFQFSRVSFYFYQFPRGSLRARPPVLMVTARLLPPGFRSGLVLRGEDFSIRVLMWWGLRGRVEKALHRAEVEIQSVHTWFSLGTDLTATNTL